MGPGARALIALAAVVVVAGGTGLAPPVAGATTPTDVNYGGYSDPWAAYEAGALSSSDENLLLSRIAGYVGSDGTSLADYFTNLAADSQQYDYVFARVANAARLGGLAPDIISTTTAAGVGADIPFALVSGGALLLAGFVTYKVVTTWLDGSQKTSYVNFDVKELGGEQVVVPGAPFTLGYDYKPAWQNTNSGMEERPFGWVRYRNVNTPNQDFWYFNYQMMVAENSDQYGNGGPYPLFNLSAFVGGSFAFPALPSYSYCVTHNYVLPNSGNPGGFCYPTNGLQSDSKWASGIWDALGAASQQTMDRLNGALSPLPVVEDTDVFASGHYLDGLTTTCTANTPYVPCITDYVTEPNFERLAPRTTTTSPPSGTPVLGTKTFTVTDPRNSGGRLTIGGELGDGCGKQIFDKIAAPNQYSYSGCQPSSMDPGAGATVPQAPPTTTTTGTTFVPFALPQPYPNETTPEYLDRLRARGWTGLATVTVSGTTNPNVGPNSPATITTGADTIADVSVWPSNPPTIATADQAISIASNPVTAASLEPAPCASCAIDWSPLTNLDLGTKFPFGTIGWLQGGLTALNPSGSCPTLVIPYPPGLGSGSANLSFCSAAWETDYRPWVFPLLKALMTIAAVAFLGLRILGLTGGGDE